MMHIIRFNKFNSAVTALIILGMTQGCKAIGNGTLIVESNPPDLNYLPVFIPFLLGGHATAVPISESVSLTAAHVAKYDYSSVIAYHPDCDVALIKSNNKNKHILEIGLVHSGESVTNYGFEFTGNIVRGEGKYVMDVTADGYPNCNYSLNDAPQKSGMSGGAVLNESGQLVGIMHGIGTNIPVLHDSNEKVILDRYSYFVPIRFIEDWIKHHLPDPVK
ncbi:trypsin-like peptidase domain-containing protein [Vibrio splendidus]